MVAGCTQPHAAARRDAGTRWCAGGLVTKYQSMCPKLRSTHKPQLQPAQHTPLAASRNPCVPPAARSPRKRVGPSSRWRLAADNPGDKQPCLSPAGSSCTAHPHHQQSSRPCQPVRPGLLRLSNVCARRHATCDVTLHTLHTSNHDDAHALRVHLPMQHARHSPAPHPHMLGP